MHERRRKFYGWGYEGDTVSPAETAEFESAWSRLLGVDHFEAVPFPKEDDIDLRAPRIQAPASPPRVRIVVASIDQPRGRR